MRGSHVVNRIIVTSVVALRAITAASVRLSMSRADARSSDDHLIAIDVPLEPDQTMIGQADAVNARLRDAFPAGYGLGVSHAPHVTLLQRFVRAKDLDAVTAAVTKVLIAERPTELRLKATGLDYAL